MDVNSGITTDKWLFIVPITNVVVSDVLPICGEWEIGNVKLMSPKKVKTLIGTLPQFSLVSPRWFNGDFDRSHAFATLHLQGATNDLNTDAFREVRSALNYLGATISFWGGRGSKTGCAPEGYPFFTTRKYYALDMNSKKYADGIGISGHFDKLDLGPDWHAHLKACHMLPMFDIHASTAIDSAWKRQIIHGTGMLGRSIMSLEMTESFIHNVIGLETLLTRPRERNGKVLAKRIKGMVGWATQSAGLNHEERIGKVHSIRCDIIHDADYSRLTAGALADSDYYLQMAILNIVNNISIFTSKDAMIELLDKWASADAWPTDKSVNLHCITSIPPSTDKRSRTVQFW